LGLVWDSVVPANNDAQVTKERVELASNLHYRRHDSLSLGALAGRAS
jgi:hypothetical protein